MSAPRRLPAHGDRDPIVAGGLHRARGSPTGTAQAHRSAVGSRAKYLDQALTYLAAQPDVWLITSDEIAEHYLRTVDPRRG